MNVDRTEAAAAYQWPADCLTMWCALPTAGGWGPSPDWLSSCITDEQASPAAHPGSMERQHHAPPINTDTTGLLFLLRCISERAAGAIRAGSMFLSVAPQQDFYCTGEDWMDTGKHCNVGLLIRRQQPVDVWPVMRGRTVCVQKHLLYFHLEKNKRTS